MRHYRLSYLRRAMQRRRARAVARDLTDALQAEWSVADADLRRWTEEVARETALDRVAKALYVESPEPPEALQGRRDRDAQIRTLAAMTRVPSYLTWPPSPDDSAQKAAVWRAIVEECLRDDE